MDAWIVDISTTGVKAEVSQPLDLGEIVVVGVGGRQLGPARVVRLDGPTVGLNFECTLAAELVQQIKTDGMVIGTGLFGTLTPEDETAATPVPEAPGVAGTVGLAGVAAATAVVGIGVALCVLPFWLAKKAIESVSRKA
jgi:hypothetical protein